MENVENCRDRARRERARENWTRLAAILARRGDTWSEADGEFVAAAMAGMEGGLRETAGRVWRAHYLAGAGERWVCAQLGIERRVFWRAVAEIDAALATIQRV